MLMFFFRAKRNTKFTKTSACDNALQSFLQKRTFFLIGIGMFRGDLDLIQKLVCLQLKLL